MTPITLRLIPSTRDGLSQDVRIRRKTAVPEFLAQHSNTWGAGLLFLSGERSAHLGLTRRTRKKLDVTSPACKRTASPAPVKVTCSPD